ncbi:hypothetical protein GOQ27_05120 [Clostridium sp. D2Q-11]|uniref:Uncharacterized protein n=1 Tax=Anaeromonas frigoriresistens TaxID=2683708 RepID=A0A942Z5V3_9FIRM|nr:hypothetical protein [Anaeromonas frigoriresistens]MBS4537831.1 hypothetical protein [Anaeromonas frigoriresistens]
MKHGINPYRTADFLDATPFVFYVFVMLAVMMDSILLGTGRFNSIATVYNKLIYRR